MKTSATQFVLVAIPFALLGSSCPTKPRIDEFTLAYDTIGSNTKQNEIYWSIKGSLSKYSTRLSVKADRDGLEILGVHVPAAGKEPVDLTNRPCGKYSATLTVTDSSDNSEVLSQSRSFTVLDPLKCPDVEHRIERAINLARMSTGWNDEIHVSVNRLNDPSVDLSVDEDVYVRYVRWEVWPLHINCYSGQVANAHILQVDKGGQKSKLQVNQNMHMGLISPIGTWLLSQYWNGCSTPDASTLRYTFVFGLQAKP